MDTKYTKKQRRTAWAEIDVNHIRHNARAIRARVGSSAIIGVVKADAYGHGAIKTAEALSEEGVDTFGVATLQEAVVLREAGISGDIVILSLTPRGHEAEILEYGFIPVVSTYADAAALSAEASRRERKAALLVALETGMGRVGFMDTPQNVAAITDIGALPHVNVKGLFSHFATAEVRDRAYATEQIRRFDAFTARLAANGLRVSFRTMANSAAVMNYPESLYEAVRPGILLYGHYPGEGMDEAALPVRPAMSVKANIVLLKKAPAGFSVSYGATFTTARESLIGTLPLGYADGLPRTLSGAGRVIVRGCYAPIVGTICMDQCMIDVTDVPGVREYDEVTILGAQGDKAITPEEIGAKTGTVNYEVICRFGQRLPKLFIYEARRRADRTDETSPRANRDRC